jgi:Uma2 family endonuclease
MTTPSMPRVELGRPATFDDLVAVPEILVAEIVDGELWTSPRPAPRHANAHTAVGARIRVAFGEGPPGQGGWRIYFEPELHLDAQVLVPDVAGWRRTRLPRLPDTAYFAVAPDWVCEVVSPSTEILDRTKKLRIYAEHGVGHTWIIDPLAQTLEVLRLAGGAWTIVGTFAGRASVRAEPFEALELQLPWLWDDDVPIQQSPPATGID